MTGLSVEFHAEATAEARAAFEWYAERNDTAAGAFLAELDRSIRLIGETPEAWPPHRLGTRRYGMRRFPFLVVFRIEESRVLVLAVAHGHRRPGYWKMR